jgi:hypothetical protein
LSILAVLIFWGAAYANIMLYDEKFAISYNLLILVILLKSSAVNFGIGYFDAYLSRMIHLSDGNRKKEKFVYATSFMIAQLLVIPVIVISSHSTVSRHIDSHAFYSMISKDRIEASRHGRLLAFFDEMP